MHSVCAQIGGGVDHVRSAWYGGRFGNGVQQLRTHELWDIEAVRLDAPRR